jgi:hypothetical protein
VASVNDRFGIPPPHSAADDIDVVPLPRRCSNLRYRGAHQWLWAAGGGR